MKSKIEAILFIYGDPIPLEKLAKLSGEKKEAVQEALEELKRDSAGRGIVVLEKDGEWQLGTNPEHAGIIESLAKSEFSEELTKAALETLAIIAYKGPLTRAEVEYVRGVNTSFTIRNLLMRGLIERVDNPKDARSYLYRISFDFLKHFGFSSPNELPHFSEFHAEKIEILDESPKGEKSS